jgi:modulator of FtsH protease
MTSLQPDQWHDLFIAVAGAAAALTGLLFVAVSISLKEILEMPGLPGRAVETLSIMTGVLVMSILVLVPGQSRQALGIELLVLGAVGGGFFVFKRLRVPRKKEDPAAWYVVPLIIMVAATVPMIGAGISLLASGGGGLYWLVAETVLAFIGSILNAWILLVEIHR